MIISTLSHVYTFEWREKDEGKKECHHTGWEENIKELEAPLELFLNFIYLVVPGLSYISQTLWSSLQHAGI